MSKTITFKYINHNGKISGRTIDVEQLEFDFKPGMGYQPGWAISGFDHEKQARRTFFLNRIIFEDEMLPRKDYLGNFVFTLIRI